MKSSIYVLFVFDLDGECKFIKNKKNIVIEGCHFLCKRNLLLFIQPSVTKRKKKQKNNNILAFWPWLYANF